jgi:hypothetical protein
MLSKQRTIYNEDSSILEVDDCTESLEMQYIIQYNKLNQCTH